MKNVIYSVLIILLLCSYSIAYYVSSEYITITVTKTERIKSGEGEKYLLYTKDEVFENTDSWLYFKFNSSDFQNKLKNGKPHKVKVAGWRVPFFSMYRNVVKIKN